MVVESEVKGIFGQWSPGNSLVSLQKQAALYLVHLCLYLYLVPGTWYLYLYLVHLWVWKRATEVAAGWREMKEGARGRVRLQAKRPCLGTICKISLWIPFPSTELSVGGGKQALLCNHCMRMPHSKYLRPKTLK